MLQTRHKQRLYGKGGQVIFRNDDWILTRAKYTAKCGNYACLFSE